MGACSVSKLNSMHVLLIASLQEVAWQPVLPLLSSRLLEADEKLPLERECRTSPLHNRQLVQHALYCSCHNCMAFASATRAAQPLQHRLRCQVLP